MVKCCYPLKSESKSHKINILIQIKGIEGIPFITRFKTDPVVDTAVDVAGIEGIPFITRFKTYTIYKDMHRANSKYWRYSIYNKV